MKKAKKFTKRDYQQEIVNKLLKLMEEGTNPFTPRWEGGSNAHVMPLRVAGEPYRGANVLSLWVEAQLSGYASPYWMTYQQAKKLGGNVKKGELGCPVIKYGTFTKEDPRAPEGEEGETRAYLKGYVVFNAEQIEGLEEKFYPQSEIEAPSGLEVSEDHSNWITATGANIKTGGDRACFVPSKDRIQMPPLDVFLTSDLYVATVHHELVHWTGGERRLNRQFKELETYKEQYAVEELTAEIGAAFLGAEQGLCPDHINDHATYLASSIRLLKDDKKWFFKAAAAAQVAVDYLNEAVAKSQSKRAA